jgi:hypothetical protein
MEVLEEMGEGIITYLCRNLESNVINIINLLCFDLEVRSNFARGPFYDVGIFQVKNPRKSQRFSLGSWYSLGRRSRGLVWVPCLSPMISCQAAFAAADSVRNRQ